MTRSLCNLGTRSLCNLGTRYIKLVVSFEAREFKIRVHHDATVGKLLVLVRRYLVLTPEEALFLFWPRRFRSDVLYPAGKLISDIAPPGLVEPMHVTLMRENCFG